MAIAMVTSARSMNRPKPRRKRLLPAQERHIEWCSATVSIINAKKNG